MPRCCRYLVVAAGLVALAGCSHTILQYRVSDRDRDALTDTIERLKLLTEAGDATALPVAVDLDGRRALLILVTTAVFDKVAAKSGEKASEGAKSESDQAASAVTTIALLALADDEAGEIERFERAERGFVLERLHLSHPARARKVWQTASSRQCARHLSSPRRSAAGGPCEPAATRAPPRRRSSAGRRCNKRAKIRDAMEKRTAARVRGPMSARSQRPRTMLVAQVKVARLTSAMPPRDERPRCLCAIEVRPCSRLGCLKPESMSLSF